MITLQDAIQLAALNRLEVAEIHINFATKEAQIAFRVGGVATAKVLVRNGQCNGIRRNPAPSVPFDVIDNFNLNTNTGFTDLMRAGLTAKKIEATCIAKGWVDASLTGTIGD